jgi:hypothetical protein
MTRNNFFTYLYFILPVIYFVSLPIEMGDLAIWIAHGKYLLQNGSILRHDIYSVLPTSDLIYPVLVCGIYALIENFFGILGVSLFHKLLIIFVLWIWFKELEIKKFGWGKVKLCIVMFSLFGCSFLFIERPALLAIIPFVLAYKILKKDLLSRLDLFYLIILQVVWVNIHGSWPILLVFFSYRIITRFLFLKKRNLVSDLFKFCIIGSLSLLNPFGYKIFSYIQTTASLSMIRNIDEWGVPSFVGKFSSQGISFFALVLIVIFFISKKEFRIKILLDPILPLIVLGFFAVRNTVWAFYIFPIFIYSNNLFIINEESYLNVKNKLNILIAVALGAVLIFFLPVIRPSFKDFLPKNKQAVFSKNGPTLIGSYLISTKKEGNIFNQWELGSYLAWAQPHKIFIDTRNIIYDQNSFNEYLEVMNGSDRYKELFLKYNIKFVVVNSRNSPLLISKLLMEKKWKLRLKDGENVLLEEN